MNQRDSLAELEVLLNRFTPEALREIRRDLPHLIVRANFTLIQGGRPAGTGTDSDGSKKSF
jgi:hypothetical protein